MNGTTKDFEKQKAAVGDDIASKGSDWRFDDPGVADNFDNHVSKSVPFYREIQALVVQLSQWFIDRGSRVLDVGCSTGTTILHLAQAHAGKEVIWTGIDEIQPMLDKAAHKLVGVPNVHLICDSLPSRAVHIQEASFVTSLWALQFCRKKERPDFIGQIYEGMVSGGALILVEKILGGSPETSNMYVELYHEYKQHVAGYSLEEIAAKAESLRGVLVPDPASEHVARLKNAGFRIVDQFVQWLNFAGWIAVK